MAFNAPTFKQLSASQWHRIDIFLYSASPKSAKKYGKWGRNLFLPISKVWLSLSQLSKPHACLQRFLQLKKKTSYTNLDKSPSNSARSQMYRQMGMVAT